MTKKQTVKSRPSFIDKLAIRWSTSRNIDGLWVGTMESKPQPGLRRVEDALGLIKHYSPLHYSRVIHNLERVWVNFAPGALAHYDRTLEACVLDERFVLGEATTTGRISAAIIHEATHARLERCGIGYDEKMRPRIEAICFRRELTFATDLPDSAELQEEIGRLLEAYTTDVGFFSDANLGERHLQGQYETLRYLKTPDWVIRALPKGRLMFSKLRKLIRYAARRA